MHFFMTLQELQLELDKLQQIQDKATNLLASIEKNPFFSAEQRKKVEEALAQILSKRQTLLKQKAELEKQPPAPEPRDPNKLYDTVGKGGKNDSDDVKLIQTLLNKRTGSKLKVDGDCGPATRKAINDFQQRVFNGYCDGLISPGKDTFKWLTNGKPLPPPYVPPAPPVPPTPKPSTTSTVPSGKAPTTGKGTELLTKAGLALLDKFIEEYANKEVNIASIDLNQKLDFGYGFYGSIGFGASLDAKLESKREGAKISSTASLDAEANISVGLGWRIGFNAWVAGAEIGAEIGFMIWAALHAETSATIELANDSLIGTLYAPSGDVSAGLDFYVKVIAEGWFLFWSADESEWAAGKLAGWTGGRHDGSRVRYNLGKMNIVKVYAPNFSLSITKDLKFNKPTKQGSYSYEVHPDLKRWFSKVQSVGK
jgi:peptidoglycan hydrolase-like protein with peptidoglycan-binding domain